MKPLKLIFTFFILSFILLIIFLFFVIIYAKFNNKTSLGTIVKNNIIKYPVFVNLINLNESGDNRYLYFNPKYQSIDVYFSSIDKLVDFDQQKEWLDEIFTESVNKRSNIVSVETLNYERKESYNNTDLNNIRSQYPNHLFTKPRLNIFFLSSYKEKPGSVGVVIHRDTIFIFQKDLNRLTEKSTVLKQLEKSTLMHEWGHLLGLEHNENPECIMSEKVEVYDRPPIGNIIVTKYCPESLLYFERMKKFK